MARTGRSTILKNKGFSITAQTPNKAVRDWSLYTQAVTKRGKDLAPVFDAFGQYMLERIDNQFLRQGTPRRWKPLAPATVREKQRLGFGSKGILERTGALRRGFSYRVLPRTLQIVNRRTAKGTELYPIHQYGTRRIPARRMVEIGTTEMNQLKRIVEGYLVNG